MREIRFSIAGVHIYKCWFDQSVFYVVSAALHLPYCMYYQWIILQDTVKRVKTVAGKGFTFEEIVSSSEVSNQSYVKLTAWCLYHTPDRTAVRSHGENSLVSLF